MNYLPLLRETRGERGRSHVRLHDYQPHLQARKEKEKTKKIHQLSLPETTEEESGGHTHKSHDGSLGVSVCEEREDDDRSSGKKTGPC
ncbi:hypothetical protein GBAR_LOCUS27640 [Geodia barretti]|uniref:Uncharacterized protein n=1 Tax=Geodia barretti TaxID=519541 RepID=A0AA35TL66_GEOBA|nr:hypothetical protein GBAR_LOCUS27640 [Geodia barretti]